MTWSLTTCRLGDGTERAAALRGDGGLVELPEPFSGAPGLMALMDSWDQLRERLVSWDGAGTSELEGAVQIAPLRYPRKVLCAGANYRSHAVEMGLSFTGEAWQPWFFLKAPSTTVVAGSGPVPIDADPSARVDWEGELGVVIGRSGRNITATEASRYVAGYVVINDVSARGPHRRGDAPAPPFEFDWVASKSQDGFCPMGAMKPSWFVTDAGDLRLRLWVNEELKQDESTADMIFDTSELIAGASRWVTLEPGDVIATGTPSGVGAPRETFLAPGDVVRVSVEGIGEIEHPIVDRGTPGCG